MTKEQQKQFEELAKPLIKWLNDNTNPHTEIIIDVRGGRVVSGEAAFYTDEYILD